MSCAKKKLHVVHDSAPDWDGAWYIYHGERFVCEGNSLPEDKEYVECIVKYWNMHDALVEACKEAKNYLRHNHGEGNKAYTLCEQVLKQAEEK